jgi:hypothetical protein
VLHEFIAQSVEVPSSCTAERSEKLGCGGGSPHLRLKNPEGGPYSRNHKRVRKRKAPGRAPDDSAVGTALGRAGVWGQRPGYFKM